MPPEIESYVLVAMPRFEADQPLTSADKRKVDAWLHHFHRNSGHPGNSAMRKILQRRRVHPGILERLETYSCPTCAEMKLKEPLPPAAHKLPGGPWLVIGSDLCEWQHPDAARDEKL